ncbi:hypothetical protein DENIS_0832 [Desulfonema ishimotonii]|uniref:VWFA domain-containing protein n=1 Tax=Desulfonema ishimotonii TaxID=45657 RepID=A0A401FSH0_9BACT|nr:VWA domain-containing protein [Desulfonema ishimotonii]GBC59890.1 hypothetical protein DENIS_0832 [Desulfonema ishimotonii]
MGFEQAGYLGFLATIPCFLFFAVRAFRRSDRWLRQFAGIHKARFPWAVSTGFFCMALASVSLSLSGPKMAYEKTIFARSGIALAVGIDVSKSMLAEDTAFPEAEKKGFRPLNRLNRARAFAMNLVSRLDGEQIGIFIFARKGIEMVPLTSDYGYCRYMIRHISASDISVPGSDLAAAIETGISMLGSAAPGRAGAVILISDGEDVNPDRFLFRAAAQQAAGQGITLFSVGTGSPGGSLIPIRFPDRGYYTDDEGRYLKTRSEAGNLRYISDLTGGQYVEVNEKGGAERLMAAILSGAENARDTRQTRREWFDLSPVFLLGAIFCFVAGWFAER